jgi:hypothetical protein
LGDRQTQDLGEAPDARLFSTSVLHFLRLPRTNSSAPNARLGPDRACTPHRDFRGDREYAKEALGRSYSFLDNVGLTFRESIKD